MGIVVFIIISTLVSNTFYIILLSFIYLHLSFTFFSLNTILFLLGFEVILVLMYFLITNWGSKLYKIRSTFYLLLFTIFGSLFLLLALVILYIITGSTNFILLENFQFNLNQQISLTLLLILLVISGSTNFIVLENFHFNVNQHISLALLFIHGFGIKVPIFPYHI